MDIFSRNVTFKYFSQNLISNVCWRSTGFIQWSSEQPPAITFVWMEPETRYEIMHGYSFPSIHFFLSLAFSPPTPPSINKWINCHSSQPFFNPTIPPSNNQFMHPQSFNPFLLSLNQSSPQSIFFHSLNPSLLQSFNQAMYRLTFNSFSLCHSVDPFYFKLNNCPTRCDCIQFIVFLYAALHVSGVDTNHQEFVQL